MPCQPVSSRRAARRSGPRPREFVAPANRTPLRREPPKLTSQVANEAPVRGRRSRSAPCCLMMAVSIAANRQASEASGCIGGEAAQASGEVFADDFLHRPGGRFKCGRGHGAASLFGSVGGWRSSHSMMARPATQDRGRSIAFAAKSSRSRRSGASAIEVETFEGWFHGAAWLNNFGYTRIKRTMLNNRVYTCYLLCIFACTCHALR